MATARKDRVAKETVVTTEVDVITLELSPHEAEVLLSLFAHIGGDPLTTSRGILDEITSIRSALQRLDGSNRAAVSLLTGFSNEELDELGGVQED